LKKLLNKLSKPEFFPEGQALGKTTGNELLRQVSTLLQVYAPNFEQNSQEK
jgi:hypothetical protein